MKPLQGPPPPPVTIKITNIIKSNQGQADNSGITSPLKPQKKLDNPKITHSKTSISHSPIPNIQITSDQQKINSTIDFPKRSFPPLRPPALKKSNQQMSTQPHPRHPQPYKIKPPPKKTIQSRWTIIYLSLSFIISVHRPSSSGWRLCHF